MGTGKTYSENEKFGISYIMWFCRACNTMFSSKREDHVCSRGPKAGEKP